MYHVPRITVPVRTWQHPQHLVVYSLSRLGLKWCMSSTSVGRNICRAGRRAEKSSQHQHSARKKRGNAHQAAPRRGLRTSRMKTNTLIGGNKNDWQACKPIAQEKDKTCGFDWQEHKPMAKRVWKTCFNYPQMYSTDYNQHTNKY